MTPSHLIGSEETVSANLDELRDQERDAQLEELEQVTAQYVEWLQIERYLMTQKLQRTWRSLRIARGLPDLQERIRTSMRAQVGELRYLNYQIRKAA